MRNLPLNLLVHTLTPSILESAEIFMQMDETIKYFCAMTEILSCSLGFADDHDNQIVHRDVSVGNLLIFKGPDGKSLGRLLDYDHAKRALTQSLIKTPYENESPEKFEARKALLVHLLSRRHAWKVDDDVLLRALKWVDLEEHAQNYIAGAVQIAKAGTDCSQKTYTASDLGWEHVDIAKAMTWPNWEDRSHRKGGRTGTLPYLSAEVLDRCSIVTPVGCRKPPPFAHQAIHDMESLLWVLVHLCLTRRGTGTNMRRNEDLDESSPKCNQGLLDVLWKCFEGDESAIEKYKTSLIRSPYSDPFEDDIVAHFHPYFDPLKPYVVKWWSILMLGYKYRADEYYHIHVHIQRHLQRAIAKLQPKEDINDDATQSALQAREDRMNLHLTTFCPKDETVVAGTPPRLLFPSVTSSTHDGSSLVRLESTAHGSHFSSSCKPPTKKRKRSW